MHFAKIEQALIYAVLIHAGQIRKGTFSLAKTALAGIAHEVATPTCLD
jgi:hypothetical protein